MKPRTVTAEGNQKCDWPMTILEIDVIASWHRVCQNPERQRPDQVASWIVTRQLSAMIEGLLTVKDAVVRSLAALGSDALRTDTSVVACCCDAISRHRFTLRHLLQSRLSLQPVLKSGVDERSE